MNTYESYKYNRREVLDRDLRWADAEEISRGCVRFVLDDPNGAIHAGIPVISDGNTVYTDASDRHTLILGSTGSKKSRIFVMPMLELIWRAGDSALVTDPKGELYDLTAADFAKAGYKVQVINLRDPLRSHGWNPFALARRYQREGNREMAAAIVNDLAVTLFPEIPKQDPFWTYSARSMLRGLSMMMVEAVDTVRDEEVNLLTLRKLAEGFSDPESSPTSRLLSYYPEDSLTRYNLNSVISGSEKTFDNIHVSYDAPMQKLYIQHSLIRLLSENTVDFTALGSGKSILYLIIPDEKTTLHPIASLIIKLCYGQLIYLAQTQPQRTLPQTVHFLLDEFSNLPAIEDMPSMISAARSRNIRFTLIAQGLHQLVSRYGADAAQTIKGNCGNWVFLTTRELGLLQELSDLCGVDPQTGKPLISVNQLQRLDAETGEVLMLLGRQYPYIAHLPDIDAYPHAAGDVAAPLPRLTDRELISVTPRELQRRFAERFPQKESSAGSFDLEAELDRKFQELFGGDPPKKPEEG